ncbi:putative hydroxymethylpyrimidine transport system permease protein [Breoghania corrubedonensis]|uniref:Putative hydroxymethylpyrimidine transport system permease protein n=1 Tax=Breoghania corrubedonensis TaxID=665038 RepID=A0A2T5V7H7_9HYPH|nr:ABC transporter permease [Breoghania corrubedonensis]PTW59707.1 putative hydroxymethylpyrimidine transport system permease protein [Breoghania corrubedonensis]
MSEFQRRIVRGLVTAILLLGAWELAVRGLKLPSYMLPPPSRVAQVLVARADFLLTQAGITAYETVLGLVFGVVSGVVLALTLSVLPLARRYLLPVVVVSQALPVFAIAPLLVLWFGFGLSSKIVMASLIIFFPVTSAFYDGLRRTDPDLLDYAKLVRATPWQTLMLIRVPAALPALGSGLRVAAVFAPIGAIVGEWVGSSQGLGFVMLQANARAQADVVFAALVLLAAMALLLRATVDKATRAMTPWQSEQA